MDRVRVIGVTGQTGAGKSLITGWLREAGFTRIRVYGDRKLSDPEPGEQRIYIKARKGKMQ